MSKLVNAYIEQYQNGLITLGELADKLHEVDEQEPKSWSFPILRSAYETNLDLVKFVVNNSCCHWGFFRENCPESDLEDFCNTGFVRSEDEACKFVLKYI